MICPACNGQKQVASLVCGVRDGRRFSEMRSGPCRTCGGEGTITDEHAARIDAGRQMREDRVARRRSLREEAARLGISEVTLSHLEQGRLE